MNPCQRLLFAASIASVSLPGPSFGIGIEDVVDGGNNFPWQRVELPGTVCGNGSQYKFWYYDNPNSRDLLVLFEGGGACWDYPSCSGQRGILSAANRNGLPDNYITEFQSQFVSPLVNGADPGIPLRPKKSIVTDGWDVVFMPYCTGDTHIGNSVMTYVDPTGENPPLPWRHAGFSNTQAAMDFLATRFPSVRRLLVSGFSAGGVASIALYVEVRRKLRPERGYMLNDSGPAFPAPDASSNSRRLHDTIRTAWDLDSLYSELPATFNPDDLGSITAMLATEFPQDQLAYTGYSSDFNFSRFSYERFFPNQSQADILRKWREDQADLVAAMNATSNFSYHIPWNRPINDSHCTSIITFIGSHACPQIRKKRWYEFFEWPWTQSWKCPRGFTPLETFLDRWINRNEQLRLIEPQNNYNNEDPGMQIVGPLINDALSGL
ncbi:MAG: pectin acetylesterase-family hydrolase [Myxococcota bacterium]